ncbi:MAG TPA: tRNA uridine-5-carboxymethylaminomethyl(34) synthesis GTPase MnmE, partial [Casimicrobiaceae bacterium]|nr:tRNA uridine-5-carboxymethylaminomethyl(34) synthesis GTPase MnmE [Casimicrobiaceae bacterium]
MTARTEPPPPAETIAAIATPSGRGAIGVVRVSGRDVPALIEGVVGRSLAPRVASLATFRGAHGETLDQGLALYFPSPHSYTGEPVLELHAHGGIAVLRSLLARCVELGARLARPGEFTLRAFLNGKLDLAQAESVADLIDAATATAARAAARSLSGAFSREVRALTDALIELRMFTEATLDFPDEDIDFLRAADARGKLEAIAAQVASVLARAKQGALLREGLTVVLIGRPNVGKSSLLNQLAGDAVAIVTPIAGTTRDALHSQIEIAGIPLTIVDTAGLRPTEDPIETLGIERTRAAIGRADVALVLIDASAGDDVTAADRAILAGLPTELHCIIVHNKIDLAGVSAKVETRTPTAASGAETHVFLSAKTGSGIELLRQEILALAGAHEDMEGAFLARERHLQALREASLHLAAAARHLAAAKPPLELFAEELRTAQIALAAIVGEFSSDDLLGAIFSRFCI